LTVLVNYYPISKDLDGEGYKAYDGGVQGCNQGERGQEVRPPTTDLILPRIAKDQ